MPDNDITRRSIWKQRWKKMRRSKFFWNPEDVEVDTEIRELINQIQRCIQGRLEERDRRDRPRKPKDAAKECLEGYSREGRLLVMDPKGVRVDSCGEVLWFKDCRDSTDAQLFGCPPRLVDHAHTFRERLLRLFD